MADVLVYRRPGCMFCEQVEELLRENHIDFRTEDVADRDEQERVSRRYGALAFPLVVVDGQYVGGFTHVIQLHAEGRLRAVMSGRPHDPPKRPSTPSKTGPAQGGSLEGFAALGDLLRRSREKGPG
ncbi:MAG: glutaredoxin family protein [Myxococcota bacterium]